MVLPPVFVGAIHVTEIEDVDASAETLVGAPGAVGVVAAANEIALDAPSAL